MLESWVALATMVVQHGLEVDGRIHRLAHVAESAKLLDRLRQLARALLDLLLEPVGSLCLLGEQLVAFQRVLAEDLDHPPHLGNLVAAGNLDRAVMAAAGNGEHAVAQTHEPADEIAADIEPDDQNRADQAQNREREEDARTQPLNRESSLGRRANIGLCLQYQAVDGRSEADGQIGIFGDQLFGLADQIELLAADG